MFVCPSHLLYTRLCITLDMSLLFPSEQLLETDSMYGRLILLNTPLYTKCKQYYFPCQHDLLNYDVSVSFTIHSFMCFVVVPFA